MENTTVEIPRRNYPPFRYSGEEPYGEFLYRWRLSALCHDVGTGIQLCEGDKIQISNLFQRFNFQAKISSIDELQTFEKQNLLADLEKASRSIKFSDYFDITKPTHFQIKYAMIMES